MPKIYLMGMPASGKSTLGRQLASKLNLPFLDLDIEIEKREERTIPEIFNVRGEEVFRVAEQSALLESIASYKSFVMALGGGTPCFRDNLSAIKSGETIYLSVPLPELIKRLKRQGPETRPLLSYQTDLDLVLKNLLQRRERYYLQAKYVVEGASIQLTDLLKFIRS